MSDLTYIPANPPKRPYHVGDQVEVLDREHKVIGTQRIVGRNGKSVTTDCGRRWTLDSRRMDSEGRIWPFPSIRLPASRKRS